MIEGGLSIQINYTRPSMIMDERQTTMLRASECWFPDCSPITKGAVEILFFFHEGSTIS